MSQSRPLPPPPHASRLSLRSGQVRNAEGTEWWASDKYWAPDGIHPNDEGYRIWGEHIAHVVGDCLRNGSPAGQRT